MEKDASPNSKKKPLPVICEFCMSDKVFLLRNAKRALIRCENCGRRLFAYYANPQRWREEDLPPENGDFFFARQVERNLLEQVGDAAQVLYDFLCRYSARYGYAPTLREMQIALGWKSTKNVRHHLAQLEEIGLIERDFATACGIRLVHVA